MADVLTLALAIVIALMLTVGIAYLLHRRLKRRLAAVLIAGFAVPVAWTLATAYFVVTEGPDGPPPGPVLEGNLLAAAVLLPVTLLVGALTIRFSRR